MRKLILSGVFFALAGAIPGSAAPTATGRICIAGTTNSAPFNCTWSPSGPSAGNTIYCLARNLHEPGTGMLVSDSVGNTYSLAAPGLMFASLRGVYLEFWVSVNIANTPSTNTLTLFDNGSATFPLLGCWATSGDTSSTQDGNAQVTQQASGSTISLTMTANGNSDVVTCYGDSQPAQTIAEGTGYTPITSGGFDLVMYRILSSSGSSTATANLSSGASASTFACVLYKSGGAAANSSVIVIQ